jgi:ribosomal protein S18 acetylase RimI-like enzyme
LGFVCVYGAHDPKWGSFIDNLHVADSAKGSGIGSSLMSQAGAWLVSLHADLGVYLLVLESNSRARRFYERLGAKNEEIFTTETHGGAVVRSCRYAWARAALLSAA